MNNTQARLLSAILSQATAGKRNHAVVEGAIFISAKTMQNVFGVAYKDEVDKYFEVVDESYCHGGGVGSKNYTKAYKCKKAIFEALGNHTWVASKKPKNGIEGVDWYKETGNIDAFVKLVKDIEAGTTKWEKMEDQYSVMAYIGCWNWEDNCQYVTYEKNGPLLNGEASGRKYAMGPSMQGMSKRLRKMFDTSEHCEIDEVNSHVAFLAAYGASKDMSCRHIDNYVANTKTFRDCMSEWYGFSNDIAKTLIISVTYHAALNYTHEYSNTYTEIIDKNINREAPCWANGDYAPTDFKPLQLFRSEMKLIGKAMLSESWASYLGHVKNKPRAIALLQQQMESERQDWYLEVFRQEGIVVETLQHDGIRIKGNIEQSILEKAENFVKNKIWEKYGIDFRTYKLAVKKMN